MSAVTTPRPGEAGGHVISASSSVTPRDSEECGIATATADSRRSAEEQEGKLDCEENGTASSEGVAAERPVTLALLACDGGKRKVLVAPALSVSLGRSESGDFHSAFLSPSLGDEDVPDFDLDAMETPSDSESLRLPVDDPEPQEDESGRRGSAAEAEPAEPAGLGALEREDVVDGQGVRWRCFSAGPAPHDSRVNMSVLEPFLRVLSHGGYYGDGMNDIIVFSSCYLPENTLHNYRYVMDNLFRYLVGTLELMVRENYAIVFLCAGGHKDKLPGIAWLKECYHTIAWRLRKNLKGVFVVHPTWAIKALITIIKPFISWKFSRKLEFVDSLRELSALLPTQRVHIPDCVALYDNNLSR